MLLLYVIDKKNHSEMSGFCQIYNIVKVRNGPYQKKSANRSYPDIALFTAFRKDL